MRIGTFSARIDASLALGPITDSPVRLVAPRDRHQRQICFIPLTNPFRPASRSQHLCRFCLTDHDMQDNQANADGVSPFGEAKIAEFFEEDESAQNDERISDYEVLGFEAATNSESVNSNGATKEHRSLQGDLAFRTTPSVNYAGNNQPRQKYGRSRRAKQDECVSPQDTEHSGKQQTNAPSDTTLVDDGYSPRVSIFDHFFERVHQHDERLGVQLEIQRKQSQRGPGDDCKK